MEFIAVNFTGYSRGGPDSLYRYRAGSQLGVIAEGRGGFSGGGLAAELAVDLLPLALSGPGSADPLHRWNLAGTRVHEAIRRSSTVDPFYRGMEAIFAAAHFDGHQIVVGNVGQNRVYRIRGGAIAQLTKDPLDDFAGAAGGNGALRLDLVRFTPQHDDLLLICTARTYHSIHKSLLLEILLQDATEPEVCAREIANSTSGEEAAVVVGRVDGGGRRGSSGAAVVVED